MPTTPNQLGLTRRGFLSASAVAPFASDLAAAPAKPNILFILMDDLGYSSLSCYGNRHVPTPNLDRLASEGVRFTQAYATPQCTPTRATLLTGQYTARNRMWHVIPWYGYPNAQVQEPPFREHLDRDSFTLAKGLKQSGYTTACIGKWHLTANADGNYTSLNPDAAKHYGFDVVATPARPREISTGDKAVDRFTNEAITFIEENRSRPWFCYVSHHSIHRIVAAPDPLVRKYLDKGHPSDGLNNATYLAAIEHFDTAIGRLVTAVDRMELGANTFVVFMSDNGGVYQTHLPNPRLPPDGQPIRLERGVPGRSNAPLRAGKGSAYEGGIRVPLIARWTGAVKPGQICETPVHAVDIMPTFLDSAGARPPDGYKTDGVNLMPLLKGRRIPTRALYWHMPFYDVR